MPADPDWQALLRGHGLPERWAGRARFVVLETGFGEGHNFLGCWNAWRQDPARCERLFFVALEAQPPSAAALAQAHGGTALAGLALTLAQAWPPLTPNLHLLSFDEGRVQLLLGFGAVAALLPKLRLSADAICLSLDVGHQTQPLPQARISKGLAALAAPGATLACAHCEPALQAQLITAGFVLRTPAAHAAAAPAGPEWLLADWAPRPGQRHGLNHGLNHSLNPSLNPRQRGLPTPGTAGRQAVVVGAGLAGTAAALALAQAGFSVTVLERHAAPAQEASGNRAGLFHGTVNADDGPYARLFRAAALQAAAIYRAAIQQGVPGAADGLLRLDTRAGGLPALQSMAQRCGLPADYVQVLPTEAASAAAGLGLPAPAWLYPGGGWVAPAAWVAHTLAATPGVRLVTGADVHRLERDGEAWVLHGAKGELLARVGTVVLANAASAQRLLSGLGHTPWPLRHTRGQTTQFDVAHSLRLPVAGDGYAIPLPGAVLCGATRQPGEPGGPGDAALRAEDHRYNLQRLQRLTGLQAPADASLLQGRTGWRLHSDDRLPIAGAVPWVQMPPGQRLDQAKLLPREPGLFVLTALGARGITLAPLLGQLVAAMAGGTPWPLEQDLADAVDPGRWCVREARHSGPGTGV